MITDKELTELKLGALNNMMTKLNHIRRELNRLHKATSELQNSLSYEWTKVWQGHPSTFFGISTANTGNLKKPSTTKSQPPSFDAGPRASKQQKERTHIPAQNVKRKNTH